MYCTVCKRLIDAQVCPHCLSMQVRQPRAEDECFLIDKQALWKDAIADLLRDEGIPFVCRAKLGAGMTMSVGMGLESFRFYVPYAQWEKACELMEDFFTPVGEDEEE